MGPPPFESIVAEHHGEIYRYLRRTVARAAEAEDLAQETFLRAYRAYRGLPPDARVRPWLFTIATNVARNHFRSEARRRRAHTAFETTGRGSVDGGAEEEAALEQIRVQLDAAVVALPTKQRLAFTLRKVHDLDYETVARSLNCSVDSARAHVFQALRKLRRSLNGHLAPAPEPRA
jgi:RNA polymerase sigma-70 factor (ECF subfamily)